MATNTHAEIVGTKLIRFADLKARGIVRNWPTLQRWVRDPEIAFPPGRMIAPNTRAWTEIEVERWLASRPAADKVEAAA